MKRKTQTHTPSVLITAQHFLRRHRADLLHIALCIFIATLFVLVCSKSTSPLYPDYYAYGGLTDGGDSLQFQTIGKAWLDGKVPYRDLFDHKGPIIFLVNALGFLLGGGTRYGIVVLQVIALAVVIHYALRLARLVSPNRLWGGIVLVFTLIAYARAYAQGNSVQEYSLPFIFASIYYLVRFLQQPKGTNHPLKYAFLHGITLAVCLLTQFSNALLVAPGILVVTILLIARRQWRNLWQNLAFGLAGILTLILPFAIYFAIQGALSDMIYAVLIYNFEYANHIGSWLRGASGASVLQFAYTFLPYLLLPFTAIMAWRRHQKPYAAFLGLTFLCESYMFLTTQAFGQYAASTIPQIILFLNELYLLVPFNSRRSKPNPAKASPATLFGLVAAIAVISQIYFDITTSYMVDTVNMYQDIRAKGVAELVFGYEDLVAEYGEESPENTPTCQTITAYGCYATLKSFYLRYDITPSNRFFVIQDWHAKFSPTIAAAIKEEFSQHPPECILLETEPGVTAISDLLSQRYTLLAADHGFELYHLNS